MKTEQLHTTTPWEARPTGQIFKEGVLIGQFNSRWDAARARDCVNLHDAITARLFQGDCFARSFLSWAAQMRSVGRALPGLEARENEARGLLTLSESETSNA